VKRMTMLVDPVSPGMRYVDSVAAQRSRWVRQAIEARWAMVVGAYGRLRAVYGLAELVGELEVGSRTRDLDLLSEECELLGVTPAELCTTLDPGIPGAGA